MIKTNGKYPSCKFSNQTVNRIHLKGIVHSEIINFVIIYSTTDFHTLGRRHGSQWLPATRWLPTFFKYFLLDSTEERNLVWNNIFNFGGKYPFKSALYRGKATDPLLHDTCCIRHTFTNGRRI